MVVDKARVYLAWTTGKGLDRVRNHPKWIVRMVLQADESLTSQAAHLLLEPVIRARR